MDSIQKFIVDDIEEEEDDLIKEESIQYVDSTGNSIPECAPRSAEELDVGIKPVDINALSKLVNLKKAKMVSDRSDEKKPYEKTGTDQTGVLSGESFKDELLKANNEVNGISDIVLNEYNPIQLAPFSGETKEEIIITTNT